MRSEGLRLVPHLRPQHNYIAGRHEFYDGNNSSRHQVQTDCGLLGCQTRHMPSFAGTEVRSPADGNRWSNPEIVLVEQATNNDDVYDAREVIAIIRATFYRREMTH